MMICKADFEELFPHVFAASPPAPAKCSKDASLSGWENEGRGLTTLGRSGFDSPVWATSPEPDRLRPGKL